MVWRILRFRIRFMELNLFVVVFFYIKFFRLVIFKIGLFYVLGGG